jgi:hypothetical protein
MLGNWHIYHAELLKPSPALFKKRDGESGN